jgi:flagellar hook assembly protein FlgD
MPVEIAIYNALGIKINVLTNSLYPQGQHRITWNGSDQHGRDVASGLYFYRLITPYGSQVRKMTLLR